MAEAGYSERLTAGTAYKTTLQSMAYSALGIMKLKTGDDAGAEKDLKVATELAKFRPDGHAWAEHFWRCAEEPWVKLSGTA